MRASPARASRAADTWTSDESSRTTFAVTSVLVGQAAESSPDLDQSIASRRKQCSNRDPVAGVLVPAGGPEDVAVAQVLVRGEGAFRRMRLEAAGLCQEGLAAPTARR